MKVHGACHCGAIRFEAEVDPERINLCNCTDCQVLSGAPFRASVRATSGDFRLLQGTPSVYLKQTAESGRTRALGFCGTCATQLYATEPVDPAVYNLRVGTLDERAQLVPKLRLWTRSALAWTHDVDAIPGTDKQ